jgi:hypothetical protein
MNTSVGTTCDNEKMFCRKSFTDFVVFKDSIRVVGHQKLLTLLITGVNATSNQFTTGIHDNWSSTLNLNFYVTT